MQPNEIVIKYIHITDVVTAESVKIVMKKIDPNIVYHKGILINKKYLLWGSELNNFYWLCAQHINANHKKRMLSISCANANISDCSNFIFPCQEINNNIYVSSMTELDSTDSKSILKRFQGYMISELIDIIELFLKLNIQLENETAEILTESTISCS